MSLRKDVGQLLIVGLAGAELSEHERAWLRLLSPGGIILFRRNIHSAQETHALLSELRTLAAEPLFRCVDVEGGLVDRLRDTVAPMPAAATVARTGERKLYAEHGRLIGREVRALGMNTTFAPVLDLATASSAEVMRTRAAAAEPTQVIDYAAAFLKGLQREKILGCGKHFPGLGGGTLDSHLATPVINHSLKQLWSEDLLPFRKLHRRLPFIMVSHAAYPAASPKKFADLPASISRFWINRILKGRIGYSGLVISDDMEMGGILKHSSMEDAAVAAVAAGAHIVEVCKDPGLVFRAYEALLREAERSNAFRRIVTLAARKARASKRRLFGRDLLTKAPTPADVQLLRRAIEEFSTTVHRLAAGATV